jgi:hypothetical protein
MYARFATLLLFLQLMPAHVDTGILPPRPPITDLRNSFQEDG